MKKKLLFLGSLLFLMFVFIGCDGSEEDISYNVSFETNGGSIIASKTIASGDVITSASTSKEGYTFIAWYLDESLSTPFTLSTKVTSDITLYAKWELSTYDVTVYLYEDSDDYVTIEVAHGESILIGDNYNEIMSHIDNESLDQFDNFYANAARTSLIQDPIVTGDMTIYIGYHSTYDLLYYDFIDISIKSISNNLKYILDTNGLLYVTYDEVLNLETSIFEDIYVDITHKFSLLTGETITEIVDTSFNSVVVKTNLDRYYIFGKRDIINPGSTYGHKDDFVAIELKSLFNLTDDIDILSLFVHDTFTLVKTSNQKVYIIGQINISELEESDDYIYLTPTDITNELNLSDTEYFIKANVITEYSEVIISTNERLFILSELAETYGFDSSENDLFFDLNTLLNPNERYILFFTQGQSAYAYLTDQGHLLSVYQDEEMSIDFELEADETLVSIHGLQFILTSKGRVFEVVMDSEDITDSLVPED